MAEVQVGWVEIYHAADGWRFRVKGRNGEVLASGESYADRRNADAVILALVGPEVEVRETEA